MLVTDRQRFSLGVATRVSSVRLSSAQDLGAKSQVLATDSPPKRVIVT
jgi:hypothetical protein